MKQQGSEGCFLFAIKEYKYVEISIIIQTFEIIRKIIIHVVERETHPYLHLEIRIATVSFEKKLIE